MFKGLAKVWICMIMGTRISPTPGDLTNTRLEQKCLVKTTPKEVSPDDLPSPLREVFGSNRAHFLTDRIQGPAKATNIKKPTDLVKIPRMLENLLFCYQKP